MIDRGCLSKDEMMRYLRKDLTPEQIATADAHLASCEFCREGLEGMTEFLDHNPPEALEATLSGLAKDLKIRIENKNVTPHKGTRPTVYKIFYWMLPLISIIIIVSLYFLFSKKTPEKHVIEESPPVMKLPLPVRDTSIKPIQQEEQEKVRKDIKDKKNIQPNKPPEKMVEKTHSPSNTEAKEEKVSDNPMLYKDARVEEAPKEIFTVVEEQPQYPGGEPAQSKFLKDNIKYPLEARELGIQGKVYVTFVVEIDGTISDTRILRGIGGGCDEEAIRVIKAMPKWIPGKQRGVPVRVQFTIPVKFAM
jgi:periplasmic protein TonB